MNYVRVKQSIYFAATLLISGSCVQTSPNDLKVSERDSVLVAIQEGMEKEQKLRGEFIHTLETDGFDLEMNSRLGVVDSLNQLLVIDFLNKYNWPKESEVGRDVAKSFFLIVQHSDPELMKTHFEAFRSLSEIGEASKVEVAMMQDRILMYEGKKQLFGTQIAPRKDQNGFITSDYYVWPIENASEVNSRRDSVGFEKSIEENARKMNAVFDVNEALD